jgi:hypothetical protein
MDYYPYKLIASDVQFLDAEFTQSALLIPDTNRTVAPQFWQHTNVGAPAVRKAKIPAYSVVNLSGDLYITRNLRLIAGISNLTDAKFTIGYLPTESNPHRACPVTLVCR